MPLISDTFHAGGGFDTAHTLTIDYTCLLTWPILPLGRYFLTDSANRAQSHRSQCPALICSYVSVCSCPLGRHRASRTCIWQHTFFISDDKARATRRLQMPVQISISRQVGVVYTFSGHAQWTLISIAKTRHIKYIPNSMPALYTVRLVWYVIEYYHW